MLKWFNFTQEMLQEEKLEPIYLNMSVRGVRDKKKIQVDWFGFKPIFIILEMVSLFPLVSDTTWSNCTSCMSRTVAFAQAKWKDCSKY